MATKPTQYDQGHEPLIVQDAATSTATPWVPLFWHPCTFNADLFMEVMMNLIKNPNINSSWLFRADILHDEEGNGGFTAPSEVGYDLQIPSFSGFECKRYMIRKLIPRNTQRDKPLDQTCLVYESTGSEDVQQTLIVYLPHLSNPEDVPFYHPKAKGVGFLHSRNAKDSTGTISIHYLYFPDTEVTTKLTRTALHLLTVISKHGEGKMTGYVKRVHHDVVIPQATFQNRYAALKTKYPKQLIDTWAETTDPLKHVFEDLGIAAFFIELWKEMYPDTTPFPGFVDIGCGNGLLVHILNSEGYTGWGFDARARKSWDHYTTTVTISGSPQPSLKQAVLIPSIIAPPSAEKTSDSAIHNGLFPKGTFIISNHADELTPWTPILATLSQCPFVMIPCCSHNLMGDKYRAPPPKDKSKSESAYSSLVAWTEQIARDCGWEVETEMLRIPSTRNTALLGRKRIEGEGKAFDEVDVEAIVRKYGGTGNWVENAMKLVKTGPRGH